LCKRRADLAEESGGLMQPMLSKACVQLRAVWQFFPDFMVDRAATAHIRKDRL
jgi:hypothetical protein